MDPQEQPSVGGSQEVGGSLANHYALHAELLCWRRGSPSTSKNYTPDQEEWTQWAVDIHRKAVTKAKGTKGVAPMMACAWLGMRAYNRGWNELFEFWAGRAHDAGNPEDGSLESEAFRELGASLVLQERAAIAVNRFQAEYEEVMGYPLTASKLAKKGRLLS